MAVLDRITTQIDADASAESEHPVWVVNGTPSTRQLFDAALLEFQRIYTLITENRMRNASESRLVLAQIAKIAGKDRSLLNPRRQAELCVWINRKNIELEGLVKTHKRYSRNKKRRTIDQLEKEVARLKQQIKNQGEVELRNTVEAFFSSNVLNDREVIVRENRQLKMESESNGETILRLQNINREQSKLIAEMLSVLSPEQRSTFAWVSPVHPF